MTAIEVAGSSGVVERWVVREYGEWTLMRSQQCGEVEYQILTALRARGISVPCAVHFDGTGDILPGPFLVLEYVDGAPDPAPKDVLDHVHQAASVLARIHAIPATASDLRPLLPLTDRLVEKLDPEWQKENLGEDGRRAQEVLRSAWPLEPRNPTAVLHADFWPGNQLWRDGKLVAVIDWEDVAVGDPITDLAFARLDLFWAMGTDAMQAFTHAYRSLTEFDLTDLAYWDLCAILRSAPFIAEWASAWESDAFAQYGVTAATMREGQRVFLEDALSRLA